MPTQPPTDPSWPRLNKQLADRGICSRREADAWIERGWVRVDGQVAQLGDRAGPTQRIDIDPAARRQQREQVTVLLNKPIGFVSGQAEDGHPPASQLIQGPSRWREDHSPQRWSPAHRQGLAPAGRLDIDSLGLLVLTQDGRIARQLIGEDSGIDKEYLVRVVWHGPPLLSQETPPATHRRSGTLRLGPARPAGLPGGPVARDVAEQFPESLLQRLRHGLSLDGQALKPAQVDWQNPEQLRFVLREGRKRQIRRMCEQVGLEVVGLKRIRIGQVVLGALPVGQWRYLGPDESF